MAKRHPSGFYQCTKCRQHLCEHYHGICKYCQADSEILRMTQAQTVGRSQANGRKVKFDFSAEIKRARAIAAKRPSTDYSEGKRKKMTIYRSDTDRKAKRKKVQQMLCTCKRMPDGEWRVDVYCALHGDPRLKLWNEGKPKNGN